jgi:hypothetical protein
MSCEKIREQFVDYLTGDLDEPSLVQVRAHLADCSRCREELESLSAIWTRLGVLPREEPSAALRHRFYDMLGAYREGLNKESVRSRLSQAASRWIGSVMPRRPVYQMALSVLLLAAGVGGGLLLSGRARSAANIEIATLRQEVNDMRQMAAVSLLKQTSPSERLMGVSWSARLEQPDRTMLEALLDTLNHDPNANVRLAAVDALYLFYNHPLVKEGLVHSIAQQTSPLVQIALINLLVEIRERRATDALRTLIQNKKLNPQVKKRAEQGLALLS